jgi:hypothetical protein
LPQKKNPHSTRDNNEFVDDDRIRQPLRGSSAGNATDTGPGATTGLWGTPLFVGW